MMVKKLILLTFFYIFALFCFVELLGIWIPKIILRLIYVFLVLLSVVVNKTIPARKNDRIVIFYMYYLVIRIIIQIALKEQNDVTYISFFQTIAPILIYFIAIRLTEEQAKKIEKCFCIFAVTSVLVGVLDSRLNILPESGAFSGGLYADVGDVYVERGYSLAGNALNTGYMCALSIGFLLRGKREFFGKWHVIFLAVMVVGLLLSYSRGALVCVGVILVSQVIFLCKQKKLKLTLNKMLVLLFIGVLIFGVVVFKWQAIVESSIYKRFISIGLSLSDGSNSLRLQFILDALKEIIYNPILGKGFGYSGYQAAANNVVGLVNTESYFLTLFLNSGLIGFVLFVCINICALAKQNKNSKKSNVIYSSILCGILVWSIFYILLDSDVTALPYWYCIGRICKWEQEKINEVV